MAVRNALLKAGANLWQPLDFNANVIGNALGGGGDDEVNRALEQLLMVGNRHQVTTAQWFDYFSLSVGMSSRQSHITLATFIAHKADKVIVPLSLNAGRR